MIRWAVGQDYTGVQAVKITKGERDPRTVPDGERAAFHFNSKWAADVQLQLMEPTVYADGTRYDPPGSNQATYTKATTVPGGNQMSVVIRNTRFPDLPYVLPLYDMKIEDVARGRFIEVNRNYYQGTSGPGGRPEYWNTIEQSASTWYQNFTHPFSEFGYVGAGLTFVNSIVGSNSIPYRKTAVVWRLPGFNTSILDGVPQQPIAGQRAYEFTPAHCRVAKPGFDVRTASRSQLAFGADGRPAAIIAGNDIALPVGIIEITLPVAVPASTVLDACLYDDGALIAYPMSPQGNALVMEYWFSGNKLYVYNPVRACRLRYIVIAFDGSAPSSGAAPYWRTFNEGGQSVMQFLRPGAGNPPRFSDIYLDSRWPCLQILAEGYLSVAAQSNRVPGSGLNFGQSQAVNFDGSGLFPMVKYMTVHSHPTFGLFVRPPQTRVTRSSNGIFYNQGGSTYCQLGNNTATFWTFNGNPYQERYVTGQNGGWYFDYPDAQIVGIRYYILGIPAP